MAAKIAFVRPPLDPLEPEALELGAAPSALGLGFGAHGEDGASKDDEGKTVAY